MRVPDAPLLEAIDLAKSYKVGRGWRPRTLTAVDGVSLALRRGESLGIVGESGCGKSTLGRCLVRLYEPSAGRILFRGLDITSLGRRRLRPIRRAMQMVFQDPGASLNPRRRVGQSIAEPLHIHRVDDSHGVGDQHGAGRGRAIDARVHDLALLVGLLPDHLARFPHELSGGQRQRVGIARALALEPELIVADEPVSALDVSIQAQIVNLMADLRERLGLTYIFIAHDLAVVRQISTRVAVMYLGRIVEIGTADAIFSRPRHPYTVALLAAAPRAIARANPRPPMIEGDPPSPLDPPRGCRFHPRCPFAAARCREEAPLLGGSPDAHAVACHFPLAGDRQGSLAA